MSSKKKMIIAICAFALVVVATIVSVVAVLAAQSVTINSTINVQYTSNEVAAKVTAHYQVANGTRTKMGGDDNGMITFYGTETGAEATQSMTGESGLTISGLTSENNYIDFIFTFTNDGDAEYTATLTLPNDVENFGITYPTKPDTMVGGSDVSFTVPGNTTDAVTYTIRYTITTISNDAHIKGTFAWVLA